MAWTFDGALETLPYAAAIALMGILAVALLALNPGSRAHRAFAVFLAFRAASMMLGLLRRFADDPASALYLTRVMPYVLIPIVPALLYFVAVYPKPRGWIGRSPWGGAAVLLLVAAAELVYLLDHASLWTLARITVDTPSYLAVGGYHATTDFGPLYVLVALIQLSGALVALLLVTEYTRAPADAPRPSWLYVGVAFTLNALFDGALQAVALVSFLNEGGSYPWAPWGWTGVLLPNLTLLPAIAAVVVLARHRLGTPSAPRVLARFLFLTPLPLLSGLVLGIGPAGSAYLGTSVSWFLLGVWRLALPSLVAYSLLRHQLFDLDLRVRRGVFRGTIAGAFVLAFVIGNQVAQSFLQAKYDWQLGGAAAGLLIFALNPIQRFAERLAHHTLPRAKPFQQLDTKERMRLYREQVELAWEDGALHRKERLMLDRLRERLGLSFEDAARLERQG